MQNPLPGPENRIMTLPNEASIYTSPRYLRSPLREYFAANDKGIYWLQASRDLGKTQLVRGVIERQVSPKDNTTIEGIDSNLPISTPNSSSAMTNAPPSCRASATAMPPRRGRISSPG